MQGSSARLSKLSDLFLPSATCAIRPARNSRGSFVEYHDNVYFLSRDVHCISHHVPALLNISANTDVISIQQPRPALFIATSRPFQKPYIIEPRINSVLLAVKRESARKHTLNRTPRVRTAQISRRKYDNNENCAQLSITTQVVTRWRGELVTFCVLVVRNYFINATFAILVSVQRARISRQETRSYIFHNIYAQIRHFYARTRARENTCES